MTSAKRPTYLLATLLLAFALPAFAQTPSPATTATPAPGPAWTKQLPPAPDRAPAASGKITGPEEIVIGKGGDQDLHAEFAYPNNSTKPLPAIIYVHGGGWARGGYKGAPLVRMAVDGYFAASIEYRFSNVAKWPAQLEDCKLAVRWLRANAAKYNVDPDRIGVFGASAGGHLVDCLATMDEPKYEGTGGYPGVSSAVQAVVDFYGPTDFTRPEIYSPAALKLTEGLFGVPCATNPALWKSGSPLYSVKPGTPPTLLVHGEEDHLVPPAQSTEYADALEKARVPHQVLMVRNAGHDFAPATPGTTIDPSVPEIQKAVMAFFDKYLKGQ